MSDEHPTVPPTAERRERPSDPNALPASAKTDAAHRAAPPPGEPTKPVKRRPDPTRYGDWEKDGRCIDF